MEDLELVILVGRVLLVGLLYVFVLVTLMAAWATMRSPETVSDAADPLRGRARLVMVNPGASGILSGTEMAVVSSATLGRAAPNTVALPDSTVSARHARLAFRDGRWWIEDLGSANGTYVNGKRVDAPVPVADGDELDVAQVRLRLEVG